MNSRKSLYDIAEYYRKGAILNASYQGMRYRISRRTWMEGEEEHNCLTAVIWSEPYCYEKTPENQREVREFPYEESSLDEIYDWLCMRYEQDRERWEYARDNPMDVNIAE